MYQKSAEELKWESRDDARTLARAEEIKADKARLARAHGAAKEILAEEAQRLNGLSKIANSRSPVGRAASQMKSSGRAYDSYSNPAFKGNLF